ncbi:hypothetical protein AX14_007802 [Amanita brunnescens Koide BX004]|nr:hypothetical protein AX14_007802 [Amanita brunnescens Koide BX004]
MSSFAPKPGCPLCGIVTSAANTFGLSPPPLSFSPSSSQTEILWRDNDFTAYREKVNPVSSKAHVIIAFNLHVPSVYSLSSSDLPLLVNLREVATRLLSSFTAQSQPSTPTVSPVNARASRSSIPLREATDLFRIGFITPPFKDNKIPVTDHLHAHAYISPGDLMGWWRGVAYGPLAWYDIDDLIAEIRESVSNNRVKSGYQNRVNAPIDRVPGAGARSGTADGIETSEPSLAHPSSQYDGEQPSHPIPGPSSMTLTLHSPSGSTTSIPTLRV